MIKGDGEPTIRRTGVADGIKIIPSADETVSCFKQIVEDGYIHKHFSSLISRTKDPNWHASWKCDCGKVNLNKMVPTVSEHIYGKVTPQLTEECMPNPHGWGRQGGIWKPPQQQEHKSREDTNVGINGYELTDKLNKREYE